MAANLPADPNLTLEQDTYLRLRYLGALIYKEGANPQFYSERLQLESSQRTVNQQGQGVTQPNPLVTIGITLRFDPELVFDFVACNRALHPAVLPVADPQIAPACDPSLGGAVGVDSRFNLTVLVDDQDQIPVDDQNSYPIEG